MKVLILSCNTGGGHNACAKYIKEQLELNNIKADVINYLDVVNQKTSQRIEKLYLASTKGNGHIFKNAYRLGELYNQTKMQSPIYKLNKLVKDKLYAFIKVRGYDLMISTHLCASMVLTEIKKEHPIHFINVATDYECVPFWNETNPDYFVIPSKLLMDNFMQKGIKKEIIKPFGIPISAKFLKIENNLNLPNDKDIVLLTSGSMGFGHLVKLVKNILSEIPNIYLLVICGTNTKLEQKLKKIDNPNLFVKGYVTNMNEYIYKSSVVITKPGGLTTSEIAALNKPLIHMMPIPGVESYNAKFFSDNKMSLAANNKKEVISCLKNLLGNHILQNKLKLNQKLIINPHAAQDLVDFIKNKYSK